MTHLISVSLRLQLITMSVSHLLLLFSKHMNKCSENSRSQIVLRTDIFQKLTLGAPDSCCDWRTSYRTPTQSLFFRRPSANLQSINTTNTIWWTYRKNSRLRTCIFPGLASLGPDSTLGKWEKAKKQSVHLSARFARNRFFLKCHFSPHRPRLQVSVGAHVWLNRSRGEGGGGGSCLPCPPDSHGS